MGREGERDRGNERQRLSKWERDRAKETDAHKEEEAARDTARVYGGGGKENTNKERETRAESTGLENQWKTPVGVR